MYAEVFSSTVQHLGVQWAACLPQRVAREARANNPMVPVVVQGDSAIVTKQVNGRWSCRSPLLGDILTTCRDLVREITGMGVDLRLEHIYREFNTVADALSNEAVDSPANCGPRAGW